MRTCAKCGGPMPLETRRGPKRKMCPTCSPTRARTKGEPKPAVVVPVVVGCVLDAARAELDAAGTINSALGQTALALAERIDSGEEKGAALASLAKQFQAAMHACAPKQVEQDDPLQRLLSRSGDELSQRRERRSS